MNVQDVNSYKITWKYITSLNIGGNEERVEEDVLFVSLRPMPQVGEIRIHDDKNYIIIHVEDAFAEDKATGYYVASAIITAILLTS